MAENTPDNVKQLLLDSITDKPALGAGSNNYVFETASDDTVLSNYLVRVPQQYMKTGDGNTLTPKPDFHKIMEQTSALTPADTYFMGQNIGQPVYSLLSKRNNVVLELVPKVHGIRLDKWRNSIIEPMGSTTDRTNEHLTRIEMMEKVMADGMDAVMPIMRTWANLAHRGYRLAAERDDVFYQPGEGFFPIDQLNIPEGMRKLPKKVNPATAEQNAWDATEKLSKFFYNDQIDTTGVDAELSKRYHELGAKFTAMMDQAFQTAVQAERDQSDDRHRFEKVDSVEAIPLEADTYVMKAKLQQLAQDVGYHR